MLEPVSIAHLNTPAGRQDPYPFYATLHERGPICPVAPGERYDFVIHGYAAVDQALRDPALKVMDASQQRYRPSWTDHRAQAVFMNSLVFSNPPRHPVMRSTFSQAFTPRRVAGMEPAISAITERLLDHVGEIAATDGQVDFMTEFAFPLPANVLGELLGVPDEDRAWYRPRAMALGDVLEFGNSTKSEIQYADRCAEELCEFMDQLANQRRAQPSDDLLSAVVSINDADGALSPQELTANLVVLFNAGFVTTTHLFGNGLVMLLNHPDAMAQLVAQPELAGAYIEEILRLEGPLHFSVRWAANDTTVAGQEIPTGSKVILLAAAANRDPNRFPDPDTFKPSRAENSTLAFGAGPHFCMGAALARLEGRDGFNRLLARYPGLRLAQPVIPPKNLTIRGYDHLYVTLS